MVNRQYLQDLLCLVLVVEDLDWDYMLDTAEVVADINVSEIVTLIIMLQLTPPCPPGGAPAPGPPGYGG